MENISQDVAPDLQTSRNSVTSQGSATNIGIISKSDGSEGAPKSIDTAGRFMSPNPNSTLDDMEDAHTPRAGRKVFIHFIKQALANIFRKEGRTRSCKSKNLKQNSEEPSSWPASSAKKSAGDSIWPIVRSKYGSKIDAWKKKGYVSVDTLQEREIVIRWIRPNKWITVLVLRQWTGTTIQTRSARQARQWTLSTSNLQFKFLTTVSPPWFQPHRLVLPRSYPFGVISAQD